MGIRVWRRGGRTAATNRLDPLNSRFVWRFIYQLQENGKISLPTPPPSLSLFPPHPLPPPGSTSFFQEQKKRKKERGEICLASSSSTLLCGFIDLFVYVVGRLWKDLVLSLWNIWIHSSFFLPLEKKRLSSFYNFLLRCRTKCWPTLIVWYVIAMWFRGF